MTGVAAAGVTRRRAASALLAVAVTVAVLVMFAGDHHSYDLLVYRGAVRTWLHGGDLYGYVHPGALHQGFTYPPFAAICLIPLAVLPLGVAAVLNAAATAIAITWTTWVVVRPLASRHAWPVWWATTIATCAACLLEPVRDTLGFGQVNLYLVALLLGDLLLVRRDSRWSGVGTGLAAAVKLTPALFLLFLLLSGRRRAAATAAIAAAAATLAAGLVAPGTSRHYWLSALHDTSRVGSFRIVDNQSLAGLLTRTLDVNTPPPLIWLPSAALVLALGMHRALRAASRRDDLAAMALVGITASLISPIAWTHHLWWVIPAVAVLLDAGLTQRRPGLMVGAVTVLVVFMSSVPEHARRGPDGSAAGWALEWVGENAYALVLLALLVALPLRGDVAPAAAAPGRRDADSGR